MSSYRKHEKFSSLIYNLGDAIEDSRELPLDFEGYRHFMYTGHPIADTFGKVRFHRYIASVAAGDWVSNEMIVVFKNKDRSDFRPENLEILTRAEKIRKDRTGVDRPHTRKFEISPAQLEMLVWEMPVVKAGEFLGVSDNAVRARCKKFGIKTPPVGYWQKLKKGLTHDQAMRELGC
ncbi:MAG: HNH endonuclease signature motif containing protein [Anaerolineaceae bacterium]|jgi:hypothetical protein|nr:HNH endonuclease signature motif containing protein [Anaerolineaceae bacterium]